MTEYFTLAEQESLRVRLREYAKAHGIGVIKLAERILEANSKHLKEVPIETLQRFIGGERIVNNALLHAIARFVERVDDPIAALGESLHRLQGTPTDKDISGDYAIIRDNREYPVKIWQQGDFWRMTVEERDQHRIFEGVVIHMKRVFVAFLNDQIFGFPRHYHFVETRNGTFADADNADRIIFNRSP